MSFRLFGLGVSDGRYDVKQSAVPNSLIARALLNWENDNTTFYTMRKETISQRDMLGTW
jgi:hypothetical protein